MKKLKIVLVFSLISALCMSNGTYIMATSISQVFDMTNTVYVETGGIALGNPDGTDSKEYIYAVKCTKNEKNKKKTKSILYYRKISPRKNNAADKKVKKSKEVSKSLEHANDMTYGRDDSKKGQFNLFVASNYDNNIFKLDPADCSYLETYKTDKKKEKIDAIAYSPSIGKKSYILRKTQSTTFHISKLKEGIFTTVKNFTVKDKAGLLDKYVLQGICCYEDHLYIALYDTKNVKSYIYKVTKSLKKIAKGKTNSSYDASQVASFEKSEIESIDIKKINKTKTVFYTANVNAGGEDSGKGDYVGKLIIQ